MNRTSWIIIGTTTAVSILIGIFMLWPGLARDWQTWTATQTAKKELSDLVKEQQVLDKLSKNTDLAKISTIAGDYIPESAKTSELILELSAVAGSSKLTVEQISLDATVQPASNASDTTTPKVDPNAPKTAGFSLKVSGSFENLMQFLRLIETSNRLVTIKSLGLTQATDKFTAELTGEAYWKKGANLEQNLANITISPETLTKFQNLTQYSTPINPTTEAGFGRVNPFDTIK